MGRESKLKGIQVESIKKQIIKSKNMLGYFIARLNALDTQMTLDQNKFDAIKERYNHLAKRMQEEKSNSEGKITSLEEELTDLEAKPIKQPNGKVICQYCDKEFSPQGIASHERACKVKFDEKARLKAELEALEKEELIPVEIPEVKEIPKPVANPDLTLQEVKDSRGMLHQANEVLAEKEAELEQKEGE